MDKSDMAVLGRLEEVRVSGRSLSESTRWWLARFTAIALAVIVCLVMLEVGLRATGRYKMGPPGAPGYFAQGSLSYKLEKNVTKNVVWPGMTYTVHTCDLGFRSKQVGPCDFGPRPYYAVLGSSDVFGNGLNYEESFIGVLGGRLKSDQIDLVNLAVDGHHLIEQRSVFQDFVAASPAPPKVVLIGLNPLLIGGFDDVHENVVVRHGDLYDKSNWRLPLMKSVLADSSADYCFFRDSIRNIQARYLSRPDYSLSFYIERYSSNHRIRSPEVMHDFLKNLKELETQIRSVGATPVYFYTPTTGGFLLNDLKSKGSIDGSLFDTKFFPELARKHSEAEGIPFIDLEPFVQELYDRGEKLNFQGDAHFNGPTSLKVGEHLYASLERVLKSRSH